MLVRISQTRTSKAVVQICCEMGKQLEEVVTKQNSHIRVKVAYINLAGVTCVAQSTHTVEFVDQVVAEASIQARVGHTLI